MINKLKNTTKNTVFISTLFGVYFLYTYLVSEKVPLPLELSVLPSLLMVIGTICMMLAVIVSWYSFSSAFIALDPWDVNYYKRFYQTSNYIKNKYVSSFVGFLIYFTITPVVLWISLYLEYSLLLFYVMFFSVPILYSFYVLTPNESIFNLNFSVFKSFKYYRLVFSHYFISILAIVSFIFYVKFLSFSKIVIEDFEFYISSIVFMFLSYMSLVPSRPRNEFEKISESYSKKTFIQKKFSKNASLLVYLLVVLFCLYPPVSSKIAGKTLAVLGLGGGVERTYYYTPDARVRIPTEIKDSCDSSKYCETKALNVMLDVGDILYVRLKDEEDTTKLFGLPGKNMFPIIQ
ncbi:hypothetical protein [Vibrio campbellii]